MDTLRFEDLQISKELLKAVEDMGFEETTPIQSLAIPPIMAGKDVIGQAQTGTGKTAAFGIPLLERIDPRAKTVQAIVLCPTRELAIQVAEELAALAAHKRGVAILPVYGGQPIERQLTALRKGVQVIVGTPGRVMDHMERGTLKLNAIALAVLDEADEMLDMGFREDIEHILADTPDTVQTVFFSATMPPAILELAQQFLNKPEFLKVTPKMLTVPSIEQIYYEVRPFQKLDALCRVIDVYNPKRAIVFCSTKRGVDELTSHLQGRGYQADGLHGNLSQAQRDRVMNRFRNTGKAGLEILVATDVAARGLDVDDVEAVINYDIPNAVEHYVHRIGRTGRAGKSGRAFTFVSGRDFYKLRDIKRFTKAQIVQQQLPSFDDVATMRTSQLLAEVRRLISEGSLDPYVDMVESFLDAEITTVDVAAGLLKLLMHRELGDAVPATIAKSKPAKNGGTPLTAPAKNSSWARLFLSLGRKQRITPRDIVGAIANETGIPGRLIGAIEIHDKVSFVDVPAEYAEEIISVMHGNQLRGLRLAVERAQPKQ